MRRLLGLLAIASTLLLGPAAAGAGLSNRLPQDAWLVAEFDVGSLRAAGWLDASASSADPLLAALRKAGFVPARDVSRLALAVVPGSTSQDAQAVVVAKARFDRKAIEAALIQSGGEGVDLGGVRAVRMPVRELRLDDASGSLAFDEPLLVSFLDDAIVLGSRRASKGVHDAKTPPGLLLSRARKEVPASASHWIVADLTRKVQGRDPAATVTKELRTLAAWATGSSVLELRAVALAADAKAASQVAMLAPVALAFVAGDERMSKVQGIGVEADAERVLAHARLVMNPAPPSAPASR